MEKVALEVCVCRMNICCMARFKHHIHATPYAAIGLMLPSDGRPPAADPHRYCEKDGRAVALPTAPVFRGQRGKGVGSTAAYKHSYHQSRGGWGKRGPKGRRSYDAMGPKTRPASRQVLSDLMDLNLALKFDKIGKQDSTRQPDEHPQQSHAGLTTRTGRRHDGGGATTAGENACPCSDSDRRGQAQLGRNIVLSIDRNYPSFF